ncbi:MAG: RagB/SusD family nutrient uptake outer membrane protein [Bacteroidales bacterium]|nr:RagB/SusD family nutrient uptake outer membrane protein [Bacteroidales bacterium]
MRKLLIYPLLAAASLMSSCTDDLDQFPRVETTAADLYQTPEQYESVLAKLYALYSIAGQEKGGGNADLSSNMGFDFMRILFNLQEAATDEVASTWLEGDQLTNLTYFSWDANDPWVADMYYRCYYVVTLCNEFLRNATNDNISSFDSSSQQKLLAYRAEARFLRAFAYYWVLDLYRKGPLVTENDNVGAYVPSVADAKGLFDYIESELLDCQSDMLSRTEAVYGRAPRAAAWMLLARLYLNAESYISSPKYTEAITYSKKVIDEGYQLHADYRRLFNADNDRRTDEIIYSIVVDAEEVVSWGASTYLVCGGVSNSSKSASYNPMDYGVQSGWGSMRARGQLPSLFETQDKRALFYTDAQSLSVINPTDQSQGYLVTKWTNLTDDGVAASNTSDGGVNTDWPVFRLAEAYLILSEAVLRGGQGATRADAAAALAKVRSRAGASEKFESDLSLDLILDERARELFWEGLRRTDLVRFDKFTTSSYLWDLKTGAVAAKYNYYPIPQAELTANPNLSNPEY